jgi:glucokinase
MEKISIGVDIGGSHITSVAVDLESRTFFEHTISRREVDCHGPSEEILGSWAASIQETIQRLDGKILKGVGFAMPGPFNYPEGIAQFKGVKKFDSLYGIDIRSELKNRLKLPDECPVRFVNDATCFAIGEAWMGKALDYKRVMAITLGTGFGSAFLREGIPIETGDEVPPQGCMYYLPFGSSNADDHFSTRWFINRYKVLTSNTIEGVRELVDQFEGNQMIQNLFREFGNNLGSFLSHWLRLFKTECLVIGGNIGRSYPCFERAFIDTLNLNGVNNLLIYISSLGENAAIAGSARLSDDDFYTQLDLSAYK